MVRVGPHAIGTQGSQGSLAVHRSPTWQVRSRANRAGWRTLIRMRSWPRPARSADRSWSPDGRATERRRSSTPGHRAVLMSDKSRRIERQFVPAATIRVQSSVGASRCGGTGRGRRPFGGGSRRWMRNASRLLAFPQGPSRSHVRYGFCRRRPRMTLLIAASATVVAVLGIILFAVHTTRPRSLRFSASVTRWLTLTLEIDSPQRPTPGGTPKHRRVRGK